MIGSIPCNQIHKAARKALTNSKSKSLHGKHAAMLAGGAGVARASMIDASESLDTPSTSAANNADATDKPNGPGVQERLKEAKAAVAQDP